MECLGGNVSTLKFDGVGVLVERKKIEKGLQKSVLGGWMGWFYSLGRLTVLSSGEDIVTLEFGSVFRDKICDRSIQKNYQQKWIKLERNDLSGVICEIDKIDEEMIVAKYVKTG